MWRTDAVNINFISDGNTDFSFNEAAVRLELQFGVTVISRTSLTRKEEKTVVLLLLLPPKPAFWLTHQFNLSLEHLDWL